MGKTYEELMEIRDDLAVQFAPEAEEMVKECAADFSTENGYGKAMSLLSMLPNDLVQSAFVEAMVAAGYPAHTAAFLRNQYNLPGEKDSQAVLMGLA